MRQGELFPGRGGRRKADFPKRKLHIARAMLRAGASSREIADFLAVSRPTVRGLLGDDPYWAMKKGRGPRKGSTDDDLN